MTDEQKANDSLTHVGLKASLETRAKLSIARMGNTNAVGSHCSEEMRAKKSAAQMGRIQPPETRAKISVAKMGHSVSPETRTKIAAAQWEGGKQVSEPRHRAKRRLLGFNPLNSPFPNCDAHHINKTDVIYMPKKLHCSIHHNQYTGQGMAQMNALAGAFLTEDWT